MSKTTITRLFIGSGIAIVAGALLSIAAIWLAIANDVFVMASPTSSGSTAAHSAGPSSGSASSARSQWPAARSAASCRGSARY